MNLDGQNKDYEEAVAEAIFEWWTSGLPYKTWYAQRYLQYKIDFND